MKVKSIFTWQNLIIGGIIAVLLFLLIRTLFDKPMKSENNVAGIVKLDSAKPEVFVDPTGKTQAQKEIIYVDNPNTIKGFQDQIDSLTVQLGVKESQIKGVITGAAKSEIYIKPDITAIIDSVKNTIIYDIDYKSRWLDIKGRVPSTEPFKVAQRDSTTIAFTPKRSGFLGLRTKYYATISSANQDMQYYNLRAWQVPEKKSKIGIGITIGYGAQYNTSERNFSLGPQATAGLQFRF